MTDRMEYTFQVVGTHRRVTVGTNKGVVAADLAARAKLDRLAESRGDEPPVSWSIELIRTKP